MATTEVTDHLEAAAIDLAVTYAVPGDGAVEETRPRNFCGVTVESKPKARRFEMRIQLEDDKGEAWKEPERDKYPQKDIPGDKA